MFIYLEIPRTGTGGGNLGEVLFVQYASNKWVVTEMPRYSSSLKIGSWSGKKKVSVIKQKIICVNDLYVEDSYLTLPE